jgi:hypothetical protein
MQKVPVNRLLIQPTVQLKWLEQHKRIEFLVSARLQSEFLWLWRKMGSQRFSEFVVQKETEAYELYNNDHLFALLTGADYIRALYPSFAVECHQPNLVWSIESKRA